MSADLLDHLLCGMKAFQQDDAPSALQGQENPDCQHETVKEWENHCDPIFGRGFHGGSATGSVVKQILMAEHGAFGLSGRATGVDQDSKIIGLSRIVGIVGMLSLEFRGRKLQGQFLVPP